MIPMIVRKLKNRILSKLPEKDIDYLELRQNILQTNRRHLSNFTFEREPLVSVIILNRNGLKYLKILFEDFTYKANYSNFEIIVVDNASSDESVDYIKSLDLNVKIIENNENTSFSKANNDAVDMAEGEYILFLNNDIEPTFGWLNEMMGTIIYNENVGAVGAKLIFPYIEDKSKQKRSFSIQHYGGIFREQVCDQFDYAARHQYKFSRNIFDEKFMNNRKCIIATAAVFLIKKETFLKLGKFDENYWYGFEDVDLNLKLYKNGYDVVVASAALLMHYESVTRKKEKRQNYVVLNSKWGDYLFKELLYDKLERNYFLTDKKLSFLFVKFPKNKISKPLRKAASHLNRQGYKAAISKDLNLDVGRDVDVLVSTAPEYDIENVNARDNLIKILILAGEKCEKEKLIKYDIVMNANGSPNSPDTYKINNLNNLAEELISLLYSHF